MTIPEQAVQAAANAAHEELLSMAKQMNVPMEYTQSISVNNYRVMRAALTAAAPHLAAVRVNSDQIEAARKAVEELANTQMNLPLEDWSRISSAILSALEPSAGRAAALEDGDLQELLERLDAGLEYEGWLETDGAPVELFDIEAAQDLFADAAAAIRALASHPVADKPDEAGAQGEGWMPIESAPKDGTFVDLSATPYTGKRRRFIDCWWTNTTGWRNEKANGLAGYTVTHWRPTPPLPSGGDRHGE